MTRVMVTIQVQRDGGQWGRERTLTLATIEPLAVRDAWLEAFLAHLDRALRDVPTLFDLAELDGVPA